MSRKKPESEAAISEPAQEPAATPKTPQLPKPATPPAEDKPPTLLAAASGAADKVPEDDATTPTKSAKPAPKARERTKVSTGAPEPKPRTSTSKKSLAEQAAAVAASSPAVDNEKPSKPPIQTQEPEPVKPIVHAGEDETDGSAVSVLQPAGKKEENESKGEDEPAGLTQSVNAAPSTPVQEVVAVTETTAKVEVPAPDMPVTASNLPNDIKAAQHQKEEAETVSTPSSPVPLLLVSELQDQPQPEPEEPSSQEPVPEPKQELAPKPLVPARSPRAGKSRGRFVKNCKWSSVSASPDSLTVC